MAADVVEGFQLTALVSQDDRAVTAAELEDEVVPGLGNAAHMVDHQPEILADDTLVVQIVLLVGVGLRRESSFRPATRE